MDMNFRILQYFKDIADTGSITAAAKKNYITQQSMSKHLRNIEDYYGKTLFMRTSPLQLTDEGQQVYNCITQILDLNSALIDSLKKEEVSAIITVGNIYSEAPPFMPEILSSFSMAVGANCSLKIIQNCIADKDSRCDIIISTEIPLNDYTPIPLLNDRIVVTVSKKLLQATYGKQTNTVIKELKKNSPLDVLRSLPFVALSLASTNILSVDNTVNNLLSEKKIQVITKTNSIGYMYSLCKSAQMACIVNEHHFRSVFGDDPEILVTPVMEIPEIVMYLYCRNGSMSNEYVKKFIEITKEYFTS